MSNAEPGLCQSCWIGRGVEKVKGADGKLRWRCARCLEERKKYVKTARVLAKPARANANVCGLPHGKDSK